MTTPGYDVTADISHRDGIPWYDAPVPPRDHRCFGQTSGWIGLTQYIRCPCGGIAQGIDLKPYENRRAPGDDAWNRLWLERNARKEDTMTDDPSERKLRLAEAVRPYDQDADTSHDPIVELQGEVEELRAELMATYDKAEAYGARAKQAEHASDYYKDSLRREREWRKPERPRRPFLSHLHDWGLLVIAVALVVFLAFAAGVWRGHRTADLFDQSTFPCAEDEALVYSPSFGPDKVGCVNREDLG